MSANQKGNNAHRNRVFKEGLVSANQKGNNAHRNRVFKEGLHPPAKAKHKVRLTPTTHCNLERQIQLCLSCTVLCPALGITVSPTHTFARQTHLLLPALSGPPHTAPSRRHRGPPLLPLRLLRHHSPSPLLCFARIYAVSSRWVEAKATRGSLLTVGRGGGERRPPRFGGGAVVAGEGRRVSVMDSAVGEFIAASPELPPPCARAPSSPRPPGSRMVSPTLGPRHFCFSPTPPAPSNRRHTDHCHALLAQRSCRLPSRREGVHLCISSLIRRQFASRFASALGGGELKAQLRAAVGLNLITTGGATNRKAKHVVPRRYEWISKLAEQRMCTSGSASQLKVQDELARVLVHSSSLWRVRSWSGTVTMLLGESGARSSALLSSAACRAAPNNQLRTTVSRPASLYGCRITSPHPLARWCSVAWRADWCHGVVWQDSALLLAAGVVGAWPSSAPPGPGNLAIFLISDN
jgi:hypothetical protein